MSIASTTNVPGRPVSVKVPCPLCGSSNNTLYVMAPSHYGPESHGVTKCSDCGMIFTNPQSQNYLQEVQSRGTLAHHFNPSLLVDSELNARMQLRLLSRYARGKEIFDFGCGNGVFVHSAIQEGWNATGSDLNSGLVEEANRYWKFNALRSESLDSLHSNCKGRFDAILSNQVFEHIQSPIPVGKILVDCLKPGGIIYIDVPYVHQPQELLNRGKTLDPTSHWNHFSIKTMGSLMEKIGCRVLYKSAAPGLVNLYRKIGLKLVAPGLGAFTKSILPPIGTGVMAIGQRPL